MPCYAPLVVLPTTTEAETVAAVRGAGYVCVLCDDPGKVKVIIAGSDVVGGDLLMSALTGLCSQFAGESGKVEMVKELWKRMKEREAGHNTLLPAENCAVQPARPQWSSAPLPAERRCPSCDCRLGPDWAMPYDLVALYVVEGNGAAGNIILSNPESHK